MRANPVGPLPVRRLRPRCRPAVRRTTSRRWRRSSRRRGPTCSSSSRRSRSRRSRATATSSRRSGDRVSPTACAASRSPPTRPGCIGVCNKIDVPQPKLLMPATLDEFVAGARELGYPDVPVCFKPPVAKGSRGFRILSATHRQGVRAAREEAAQLVHGARRVRRDLPRRRSLPEADVHGVRGRTRVHGRRVCRQGRSDLPSGAHAGRRC